MDNVHQEKHETTFQSAKACNGKEKRKKTCRTFFHNEVFLAVAEN